MSTRARSQRGRQLGGTARCRCRLERARARRREAAWVSGRSLIRVEPRLDSLPRHPNRPFLAKSSLLQPRK